MQFEMAANVHLEGTNMLKMLTKIGLGTDAEGNIEPHVVKNIRMMLRKAAEMTPDDITKGKFNKMLEFVEEY